VTKAGDWKLAGFENSRAISEGKFSSLSGLESRYYPPELSGGSGLSSFDMELGWSLDSWCIGCLVYECFNGALEQPKYLSSMGKIPSGLQNDYKRLLATSPKARLSLEKFCDSAFFSNDFVHSIEFMDNLALQSDAAKEEFFKRLPDLVEGFPPTASKFKVLPLLVNGLSFGSGASAKALNALLIIGKKLERAEYRDLLIPLILKLYSMNERSIRVTLLKNISFYINFLEDKEISDQILPCMKTGFLDTATLLREWTVKSLVYFAPRLKDKTFQTQVLPFLAKLQVDPEPSIRTNTIVVVGKLAKHLSPEIKSKLLLPTFLRALRDPFVPARKSAVAAFKATSEYFAPKDIASKIVPILSMHCIDPSKEVRESSLSAVTLFVEILYKHSSTMTDVVQAPGTASVSEGMTASSSASSSKQEDESSLFGSISAWAVNAAVSSIKTKIIGDESKGVSTSQMSRPVIPSVVAKSDVEAPKVLPSAGSTAQSALGKPVAIVPVTTRTSKSKGHEKSAASAAKYSDWDSEFFDDVGAEVEDISLASLSTKKTSKVETTSSLIPDEPIDSWSAFDPLENLEHKSSSSSTPHEDQMFKFDLLATGIPDQYMVDQSDPLSEDPFAMIATSPGKSEVDLADFGAYAVPSQKPISSKESSSESLRSTSRRDPVSLDKQSAPRDSPSLFLEAYAAIGEKKSASVQTTTTAPKVVRKPGVSSKPVRTAPTSSPATAMNSSSKGGDDWDDFFK